MSKLCGSAHHSIHNMMPLVPQSICLSVHLLELSLGGMTKHVSAALQEAGLGVIFQ